MFQLDDKFLTEVGLAELPAEQRQPFLQHIYSELELRVGTKLSEGLNEDQLKEFEAIIGKENEVILNWLQANAPDYKNDEAFGRLKQLSGFAEDDTRLRDEYAATKWLEINRPDYRDVVKATLDQLKQEVSSNKEAILSGASTGPQQPDATQQAPQQPPVN
jgi:hypothetical protein